MQTITLYRYPRSCGGITVSPVKPYGVDYEIRYRLIAADGKEITNGDITTACIDTDSAEGWTEIDAPQEENAE